MSKAAPLPENCLNCGAALQGRWCHQCGQKAKSSVRHFGSVLTDILDTVFEYDNRIWKTLFPLYFMPGRISRDYIEGRRVRYVLPFRLFFVLSVVAFLTLQFTALPQRMFGVDLISENSVFTNLDSEAAVLAERDRLLAEMQISLQQLADESGTGPELARRGIQTAIGVVEEASAARLEQLRVGGTPVEPETQALQDAVRGTTQEEIPFTGNWQPETPQIPSFTPPEVAVPERPETPQIVIDGGQVWHPQDNPMQVAWLPANVNLWLNQALERAMNNMRSVSDDPGQLIEAMLNLLPLVIFFMMPVFALLLKLFYLFSGRLYMEHFIVALHSHCFLFFALLISLLLNALSNIPAMPSFTADLLQRLYWVSLVWIPVYLLLMQRRVYDQGWILTILKYQVIGAFYLVMLFFALFAAAAISLIRL
jgi:hypothetical protein